MPICPDEGRSVDFSSQELPNRPQLRAVRGPSPLGCCCGLKSALRRWVVGLCLIGALAGCSTEGKYKWLSFFFDGVPVPGATNAPTIVYDENGRPLDTSKFVPTNVAAPIKAVFTPHPPYEEKKCTECHESRFTVKMKGPQDKVCFSCHQELGKTFTPAKVKHQPAENGECSSCHDPHGSANPKMLVEKGEKLCAQCHEDLPKQLATAKVKHQP